MKRLSMPKMGQEVDLNGEARSHLIPLKNRMLSKHSETTMENFTGNQKHN